MLISIMMAAALFLTAAGLAVWRLHRRPEVQPGRPFQSVSPQIYDGTNAERRGFQEEYVTRVTINDGEIARMMGEIQNRIDQHPIVIPMQADPFAALPHVTNVTIHGSNAGPIVTGNQSSASVGISTVATSTGVTDPGQVRTAEIVAEVLRLLPDLELPHGDRELAEEAGQEILTEIEAPTSDDSKIRKAWVRMRGALAPVAFKVLSSTADAGADEAGKLTRSALEALMHHTI